APSGLARAVPLVAAAVALGVLLLATLVPSRANAADLLARAERAAVNGTIALSSYRGTITGENWMGDQGKRAAQPSTFEQTVSFAAPNKLRLDVTATAPNGAGGKQVFITDGTTGWIYAPDANVVQPVPPQFVLQNGPFAASTLGAAIESFSPAFDATQLADETAAGRAAYVLNLVPKQGNPMAQHVGKVRLWIDQQTLLQLGAEMSDASGALLMRWRVESLALNVALAPDTFVFTPPADAHRGVIVPPQAMPSDREQVWATLARAVPFQLFRPLVAIEGLEEIGPGRGDNGVVVVPFRVPNGPPVVVLAEGPSSAFPQNGAGTMVTLGEVRATYRLADGVQSLDFDRAGTHVRVQAPAQLPKEALFGLVASLAPVPNQ
ncbi:MAG TPA: outer membrane lipoprotein-sorting protein, partial [Candidatus Limnocylindria bacterium]|nr:outer membrane lipoprotein-sorting protein [Candidatus Limnocylindria bacterium]